MKNPRLVFALLLTCLLIAALLRCCHPTPLELPTTTLKNSSETAVQPADPSAGAATRAAAPDLPAGASSVAAIFSTPMVFYGSVQTQDGVPVAEAQVTASVANRFRRPAWHEWHPLKLHVVVPQKSPRNRPRNGPPTTRDLPRLTPC
jgi:hypothetical protein